MASIRQRNGKWQARVARKGHPTQVQTFATRSEAQRWARKVEVEIDRGTQTPEAKAKRLSLRDLLLRYLEEVTPTLRSCREDRWRIKAMAAKPIAEVSMAALLPEHVAKYRDQRLTEVSAGTVLRELAYLSLIINHARREWRVDVANPVSMVRKPTAPPGRDRVLTKEEELQLLEALKPLRNRSPWTILVVELALATAMRRGELFSLTWDQIDFTRRTARLPLTKNGTARTVPLSTVAITALHQIPKTDDARVFPLVSTTFDTSFKRAVARAGLRNLRFHDLRHTAITRMAEKLPNVIELAAVSGHRSLRMLQRYYHPKAEDLARKLG